MTVIPKCYVLYQFANSNPNYTSWMEDCPLECEVVQSAPATWEPPADAGIVVTHMHYRWEEVSTLRRIYEAGRVPILILADGILEYRNTWENPSLADGALFQPLIGHKLACLGRAQARTVESWGAVGKCEVVGLPRLDNHIDEHLPVQTEGPFRLLITTASTPAFTESQRATVIQSLADLKKRFERNALVNQRQVEVTWRLTAGLEKEIGVAACTETKKVPLSDAIELSDAVITTPSTNYLESVIKRRPTAVLDYSNSPAYVQSAWNISSPAHINSVLQELERPPAPKMKFQSSTLHDQLEIGDAKQRLHGLIKKMAVLGVESRRDGNQNLKFPARMIPDAKQGFQKVETDFDIIALYPHNSTFRTNDADQLKQELNLAIARLKDLPDELTRKELHIESLSQLLEEAEARISASRQREAVQAELVKKKSEYLNRKTKHIASLNDLFQSANDRAKQMNHKVIQLAANLLEMEQEVSALSMQLSTTKSRNGPAPKPAANPKSFEPIVLKFPQDRRAA